MAGGNGAVELIDLTDAVEAKPRPRKRMRGADELALMIDLTGGPASPHRRPGRPAVAEKPSAAQENVAQPGHAVDLTDSHTTRKQSSVPVKRQADEAQWDAPPRRRRTQREQRPTSEPEGDEEPAEAELPLQPKHAPGQQQQQQQQEGGKPCSICFEDEGPLMHSFVACGHRFCLPCLREYVSGKVQHRVFPVVCPLPDCKAPISAVECGLVLAPEEQATLDKMEAEAAVGEGVKLFCPNPKCSQLLIADDKQADTPLDCPYCAQQVCAQCSVAWHEGLTCQQYQAQPGALRSKDDQALLDLAEKAGLRRCPGCGQMVERTQGCSHMHCRCGAIFCYSCGRSKKPGSSHYCNCKPHAEQWMHPPPQQQQQLQARHAAQQLEQAQAAAAQAVAERRAAARAAQRAAHQQQQQQQQALLALFQQQQPQQPQQHARHSSRRRQRQR